MSTLIHLVAEQPHYLDHMLGIWNALPHAVKGKTFLKEDRVVIPSGDAVLVAGYSDLQRVLDQNRSFKKAIYVEHGAGQSYVGLDIGAQPYWSGGPQHRNVIGYLCPNAEVAGRWNARYPDKPTFVIGSPRLDPWHAGMRGQHEPRTVAITFHWDAQFTGVPETASAFGYYLQDLPDAIVRWQAQNWRVIGHAHPRYAALADWWRSPEISALGVEFVEHSDGVLDRAGVLVADNTSLQAEFLSLGRPVVWLNHRSYRKDVSHGGRFWQWPELGGQQVDDPCALASVNLDTLPPATGHPYAFADGNASQRGADAVLSLMGHDVRSHVG